MPSPREIPVRFHAPQVGVAHDAIQAHTEQGMLTDQVRGILPQRVAIFGTGIVAVPRQPAFGVEDLLNLPNRHFYLRLMIDASPSRPFSAVTLDRDEVLSAAA